MLSISEPLKAEGAEKYYDRDNYYLESQGYWHGNLADHLNLTGEINESDFKNVLRGFNQDGEALVATAGKESHRAGIDMTFSAPKSVSLLSYQDSRIQDAFNRALHDTLDLAENTYAQTRHKKDGIVAYETTGNAVFAIFNHRTSRELDPQLHAHCVMMNMTKSDNGNIMTLDNAKFYENKMMLGQHFRNQLAMEIQKLGYQVTVTDRQKGFFEIAGVPGNVIDTFSKRREQIEEKIKELRTVKYKDLPATDLERWAAERLAAVKENPHYNERLKAEIDVLRSSEELVYKEWGDAELAALATTGSRIPKRNVTEEYIINQVNTSLADQNLTLASLTETAQAMPPKERDAKELRDIINASIETVTKTEAAFTREDLMKRAMKLSIGDYTYSQLEEEFEKMIAEETFVHLRDEYKITKGVTALYTTAEMKDLEHESIEICQTSKTDICVDESVADDFIESENNMLHFKKVAKTEDGELEKMFDGVEEDDKQTILRVLQQFKKDEKNPPDINTLFKENKNIRDFFYRHGQGFTPGQLNALKQMVATKCQFSVIQGDAGTGKSFSMMYAKRLLESNGYSVRGLAPTGKATDELAKAARLDKSLTIDKFVLLWEKSEKFRSNFEPGKECFVIDEAGMIGSKLAHKFIKIAQEINAKAVFVGDRKQFAAVSAGKFFSDLQDKAGVDMAIMPDVMRQKTAQTKDIVKAISSKNFDVAFNHLLGYNLANIKKSKAKNYRVGQRLLFDQNPNSNLYGINAEVIGVKKTTLTIRYPLWDGTMKEDTIEPRACNNDYTVFTPNANETEKQYNNCISEISDEDKRLQAVADDYLQCYNDKRDALVITATNDDRQKLNSIIRKTLVEQKHVADVGEYTLYEPKSVSDATLASSYAVGQIIELSKEVKGEVCEIDHDKNLLTIKDGNGNTLVFDPVANSKNPPNVFNKVTATLGNNEKIAFLKNGKVKDIRGTEIDIRNGQLATITSIDKDGNIIAAIGEGGDVVKVKFNISEYNNFTTAYALSSHKSQGMTVDKIIWHANTQKEISSNSFYVAITRCKSEVAVYTDDTFNLQKKAQREQEKYSTINDAEQIVTYKTFKDVVDPVAQTSADEENKKISPPVDYAMDGVKTDDKSVATGTKPNVSIV